MGDEAGHETAADDLEVLKEGCLDGERAGGGTGRDWRSGHAITVVGANEQRKICQTRANSRQQVLPRRASAAVSEEFLDCYPGI
jgi:hypothetical protein